MHRLERGAPKGVVDRARAATFLDETAMWPTSYALTKLTAADEKKIAALVKRSVS